MKHLLSFFVVMLLSITFASAQQFREVLYLNNGSVIKGTIIEQVPNVSYKIETSDGSQFVYSSNDVLKITKEPVAITRNIGVKYQGEVIVGFGAGVASLPMDRICLRTIQGVRVGECFSAGLGVGLNTIISYELKYISVQEDQAFYDPEYYMPLYLNMNGYLPVSAHASMLVSLDIGGGFGLSANIADFSGLMVCPALGICVNDEVNFSLGYEVQKMSDGSSRINMNAVALKIGYMF